jgi:50S ribosomal subunit-associated GTPase HflX
MEKFLIHVRDIETDDTALLQIKAETKEDALKQIDISEYEIIKVLPKRGGKREGAGRVSRWGDGVKTDRYRLPVQLGENIYDVVNSIEDLRGICQFWRDKLVDSQSKSQGKTSERYKHVEKMLEDIEACLSSLPAW